MGWSAYHAKHYKSNGEVDRKAECDELINDENHVVIKSTMVGSVYYAAVRQLRDYEKDEKGDYKHDADGHLIRCDIPFAEQEVWAAVFRTGKDDAYFNFAYKGMDETCGPCDFDCPRSILELLTPTDNKDANTWREHCWERISKKKWFTELPFGSRVRVTFQDNTFILEKTKPGAQFKTWWWRDVENGRYMPKKYVKPEECELIA